MIETQATTRQLADQTPRGAPEDGMWTSEYVPNTEVSYRRRGVGERAIVFVHGFLDDQHVWDTVIAELTTPGIETVEVDLAGMGARYGAGGPFTYDRFAADVTAVVDALGKPFVIAGQSMGAPIAELVAAARPDRAVGVVLLTPAPLAGVGLPDEAVEPFRSLGWDPDAQRAVREQLSTALPDPDLRRLVGIGAVVRPDVVRELVDTWNTGLREGAGRSAFTGPVLILRGADDGFITEAVVSAAVSPRFASAETVAVEGAGHWPHLERPSVVAAQLDRFLTDNGTNASEVGAGGWKDAFAQKSAGVFGQAIADDVVLEASVMRGALQGRESVMRVMGIASGIYESVLFTHQASHGPRTYLEWEVTAFGGMVLYGVTVLTTDEDGQIVHAAIHHRPLDAALRFSQEMRARTAGVVDPDRFYDPDDHNPSART